MRPTTRAARRRGHLSRHERQRLARAEAFSRRSSLTSPPVSPVKLGTKDLELIDRLVRGDRTVVATALLAIGGIPASEIVGRAVLSRIADAACWALAEGAITPARAEQIARHAKRAITRGEQSGAA